MLKHPTFWTRHKSNVLKKKEENLQNIWQKINNNEDLDILLILHELSEWIGKEIN